MEEFKKVGKERLVPEINHLKGETPEGSKGQGGSYSRRIRSEKVVIFLGCPQQRQFFYERRNSWEESKINWLEKD
ncbi:MAG: hypothetical protein J7L26_04645 [Candidatus Aminicenantes bacterium]|nr:hypothetical protein [Candidatus Aminicenantes bacterium]